jgi:hypothetical protein
MTHTKIKQSFGWSKTPVEQSLVIRKDYVKVKRGDNSFGIETWATFPILYE